MLSLLKSSAGSYNMVRPLINIYKKISNHPLTKNSKLKSLFRYLSWQLYSHLIKPEKVVVGYQGIHLRLHRFSPSINALYYFGLTDYQEMSFLLNFLNKDFLFIDVGANHGAYTLLAQITGTKIIAYEPNPLALKRLISNLQLNGDDSEIQYRPVALGEVPGFITMTEEYGQQNHIVDQDINGLLVAMNTLDNEIAQLKRPCLIKIDVEGYELKVLKGGNKLLENPLVKAVIVEMMGLGNRYGSSDLQVHEYLLSKGFKSYTYMPSNRNLEIHNDIPNGNGLYLRDLDFINTQLNAAAFNCQTIPRS